MPQYYDLAPMHACGFLCSKRNDVLYALERQINATDSPPLVPYVPTLCNSFHHSLASRRAANVAAHHGEPNGSG